MLMAELPEDQIPNPSYRFYMWVLHTWRAQSSGSNSNMPLDPLKVDVAERITGRFLNP